MSQILENAHCHSFDWEGERVGERACACGDGVAGGGGGGRLLKKTNTDRWAEMSAWQVLTQQATSINDDHK